MKTLSLPAARWGRRRIVLLLSVLLGVCVAPVARAQVPPQSAGVNKTADLTYLVWASNPASKHAKVQLIGADNRVWYEQFSTAHSFGQRLDLSELPDGRYAIVVNIGRDAHRFDLRLHSTEQRVAEVGPEQQPGRQGLVSVAPQAAGEH